jgi:hypothetical protein
MKERKQNFAKKLWIIIWDPLKVIPLNKLDFFVWLVFTIIAGQLGIIINVIQRHYSNNTSIVKSIYLDSISGSFYIFSIATVASMLGPLFNNFIRKRKILFGEIKVLSLIFSIFFLFFSGIIYSIIQAKTIDHATDIRLRLTVDWTQTIIYCGSLLLCIYLYCVLKIDKHKEQFRYLDYKYSEQEDGDIKRVTDNSKQIQNDGKGNRI